MQPHTSRHTSRLIVFLFVGTLASVPSLPGCSGPAQVAPLDLTDPDLVVAEYASDTLTLSGFEGAYITANGTWETAASDSVSEYQDFLDRYVNFRLKVQQARDIGLESDSSTIAEVAEYRDQLARPFFTDQAVLDDIIDDLHEKQQEEIQARHILVRLEENATPADTLAAYERIMALRDSVEQGGDFGTLAFLHSEDPSARRNRGDLGYFTGGRMILDFENAAYNADVGSIAGPVRTRFGYHLIKVDDRRPRTPEIRASHILIRIQGDTAADTTTAMETITQLRDRVLAGEDFNTLARQYSDDVASGRNGGDLGFFGVGRMVPPFNDAAFALENPGDISDIVESRFGFHLIKLEEKGTLPDYEEAYPDLKRLANELPRTSIRSRAIGMAEAERAGLTIHSDRIEQALGLFDADSLFLQVRRDGFGEFSELPVADVGDETYTFSAFRDYMRRSGVRAGADQVAQFHDQVEVYVSDRGFDAALNSLEERDEDFRDILKQYVDGVLLFKISEDSVWTPAAMDENGLRAHHAARTANYSWPERRRVLSFTSPSDSMLTMVAADLDNGTDPQTILSQYEESPLTLRLDTLFVADSTDTPIDLSLSLNVGERTGVVPERSRLAVYYLDAIESPREKTFEEARAEVVTEYQELLEAAWVRRLRDQYNTVTYPERVIQAFSRAPLETVLEDTMSEPQSAE